MNETRTIAQSGATRLLAAAALSLSLFSAKAITFTSGDLVIGFRQPSGSSELVVDLGYPTKLSSLSPGTTITITNFSTTTFFQAFSDPSDLDWSVFGSTQITTDPNYAHYTEWATGARTDPDVQTIPYVCEPASVQASSGGNMASVGLNAVRYQTSKSVPVDGVNNTATSIIIPAGSPLGYGVQVGIGNWNGKFLQGDTEAATPDSFAAPQFVRADLYYMPPGSGNAIYWGYFQLNASGTMTYMAAYRSPPVLTSISPSTGVPVGGTTVTLTGSGFIAGNVVVEFGGVLATSVQFVNSTTVTAVAPAGAAGTTDVLVANSDGQSSDLAAAYTYQAAAAPPALTGISPASGLLGGATLVTLTGSNFISGITVSFGSLSASSVNFSNSALITAVTPAAAAGAVNVTVTNPDAQTSTLTNGFTYMAPPPALWGVSPTNGVPGGGTLVTLTGSNFVSGITVSFGLLAASSVNFSNSTLITAVAPAAAAGAVNVTVTNPDTQTSTLMNGFTYAVAAPPPQPTISMATMSGANLVLVLAGSTNASCRVLTSTNPASAVAYWMPVATNAVGAGGLFTNTIPITQAERQRYFLISIP